MLGNNPGLDETEKWQPGSSSLFQVLLSIQGLILIQDPYYVQGETGMRGTAEGDASALRYHAEIWLNTMRHAMTGVLRSPRPGFEDVIQAHFRWGVCVLSGDGAHAAATEG